MDGFHYRGIGKLRRHFGIDYAPCVVISAKTDGGLTCSLGIFGQSFT